MQKPSDSGLTNHDWLFQAIPMDVMTDCESLWGTEQGHNNSAQGEPAARPHHPPASICAQDDAQEHL
eukprot:16444981-Heterocapsa_arctica.AAC.1